MSILAIDYGEKRVGIAVSAEGYFAKGLTIIKVKSKKDLLEKIEAISKQEKTEKIIVGLPRTLENEIGPQAKKVQEFIKKLKEKLEIPVIPFDETLTTNEAKEGLKTSGASAEEIEEKLDEEAARLILQEYLDQNR